MACATRSHEVAVAMKVSTDDVADAREMEVEIALDVPQMTFVRAAAKVAEAATTDAADVIVNVPAADGTAGVDVARADSADERINDDVDAICPVTPCLSSSLAGYSPLTRAFLDQPPPPPLDGTLWEELPPTQESDHKAPTPLIKLTRRWADVTHGEASEGVSSSREKYLPREVARNFVSPRSSPSLSLSARSVELSPTSPRSPLLSTLLLSKSSPELPTSSGVDDSQEVNAQGVRGVVAQSLSAPP